VFCFKNKSEKNKSGSLEPDLLVVAVVTVLIRGSIRCGEFDNLCVGSSEMTLCLTKGRKVC